MEIKDIDLYAAKILDSISKDIPPAQYPTMNQILVLMELARKLKLYDAYDLLRRTFPNA